MNAMLNNPVDMRLEIARIRSAREVIVFSFKEDRITFVAKNNVFLSIQDLPQNYIQNNYKNIFGFSSGWKILKGEGIIEENNLSFKLGDIFLYNPLTKEIVINPLPKENMILAVIRDLRKKMYCINIAR